MSATVSQTGPLYNQLSARMGCTSVLRKGRVYKILYPVHTHISLLDLQQNANTITNKELNGILSKANSDMDIFNELLRARTDDKDIEILDGAMAEDRVIIALVQAIMKERAAQTGSGCCGAF